jgi:hypothetical protein
MTHYQTSAILDLKRVAGFSGRNNNNNNNNNAWE